MSLLLLGFTHTYTLVTHTYGAPTQGWDEPKILTQTLCCLQAKKSKNRYRHTDIELKHWFENVLEGVVHRAFIDINMRRVHKKQT